MNEQIPPSSAVPPASEDLPDFRRLFERHFPSVVRFFRRLGFSPEEARDLTQETFLRVHNGMARFRGESRFETWLYQIAKRIASNARRYQGAERRRHLEVSLEELLEEGKPVFPAAGRLPVEEGPALRDLLAEERSRRLRQALGSLPPKMRQVLLLRIDQGLKYREIAVAAGISIETVKAHLFHAKAQLIEKVTGGCSDADQRHFEED